MRECRETGTPEREAVFEQGVLIAEKAWNEAGDLTLDWKSATPRLGEEQR